MCLGKISAYLDTWQIGHLSNKQPVFNTWMATTLVLSRQAGEDNLSIFSNTLKFDSLLAIPGVRFVSWHTWFPTPEEMCIGTNPGRM